MLVSRVENGSCWVKENMITNISSVLIWCIFWILFLLMPISRVRWWTILYYQSYPDALFNRLVLKHLLLKSVDVIKVKVHTNCKFIMQGFIQEILMSCKRHKNLNLLFESLSSIFINFILKHKKNRSMSNLHSK